MVSQAVQRTDRDVLPAGLDMNHMSPVDPHRGCHLRLRQAGSATRGLHTLAQLDQPLIHMLTINHIQM